MSSIDYFIKETLQNAAAATGNGTSLQVIGFNTALFDVTISASATVTFEATADDSSWVSIQVVNIATGLTSTTATATGLYRASVSGVLKVRARISTFGSGTVTVKAFATTGGGSAGGGGGDTELPAAAALADATANPTTTSVGSYMHGFNGTTWDRIRTAVTAVTSTFTGFLNSIPWAIYHATPSTRTDGQGGPLEADATGNLKTSLGTELYGEDPDNDLIKTEQRFSGTMISADTLVKSGSGFIHTLTFACIDAAPTAGTIIVYDNTAESGTILYSETFDTTVFRGYSVLLDVTFSIGLYVGFTTTADVGVTPSIR